MTVIRQLETELAQEKEEMAASLEELREATHEALDWRAPVRQRPLQALAIATAVGVGLGVLSSLSVRPRRGNRWKPNGKSFNLAGFLPLLLPAIGRPLAGLVEDRLRGMMGVSRKKSHR